MKISDLIRGPEKTQVQIVKIQQEPEASLNDVYDSELLRMRQIAGLLGSGDTEYSNSPEEKYAPLDSVIASGDDVHKSKHPSDIRSNSISMYPNFQAKG